MPGSLASHLRGLDPDDFLTLIQRRTETKQLLDPIRRKDMAALTDLLAAPHGIRMALGLLNTSLSQLLQLLVWLGPRVSAASIAEQAPGVPMEELRACARELGRWGLAFIDERQSKGPGDWWVDVPACTSAAVPMPPGFGPPARRLLARRNIHFLATLSRNVGLPTGPRPGQEAMVAELSAALAEPDRIGRLLSEAPPKAIVLFQLILDAGGSIGRRDFMSAGHIRWSDPPWSERRQVITPLDWLESHGLVLHDESDGYAGSAVIPAEVGLALRGGRLFGDWPAPAKFAVEPAPEANHPGDPSRILGDLEAVVDEWGQTRPQCLQRGGLGVRELKKTAKTLGFSERYVSFLYALAVEAELVGMDEEDRLVPSVRVPWWTEQPPPLRWDLLLSCWHINVLWSEEDHALIPLDKVGYQPGLASLRVAVARDLARLAPGTGTDVATLASRLVWQFPNVIHPEMAPAFVEGCVEALVWLGAATGPRPVALVEPGRSAATRPRWFDAGGPGTAAFPAEVASCTVGADMNVIVPGPPVHELRSALSRFADLKASSPARIYQISEASVRRALDAGMQVSEILSVLEGHASTGIPQNVVYLIEDVGRRHGHLVVGQAGVYLRSDDPGLLRAAAADRRIAAFRPRLIAPTVAIMDAKDVASLLAALRNAGYLPVAEAGGATLKNGPAGAGARRILLRSETPWTMGPEKAAELAAAVLGGARNATPAKPATSPTTAPGPPNGLVDGRTLTTAKEIRKAIGEAVKLGLVVEIAYRSAKGETARSIEPFEIEGDRVEAWCRLRDDERQFFVSRIVWARVTGETFDVDQFGPVDVDFDEEEFIDHR